MGNAESFGIIRDKENLKALFVEEFSGSLSFERYDTIYSQSLPHEPLSDLEQIEKYCNEVKSSKAWSLHPFPGIMIESFSVWVKQGSIWSDFVPVIRANFEFESQAEIRSIFESLTSPEKIKCWDDQRTDLTRTYKENMVIEEYSVRFPFKTKTFQDFFGIKENADGFEITSFRCTQTKTEKSSNFFNVWKVKKVKNKVMVQRLRHVDMGLRNCKNIEEIYAKLSFLNCKSFLHFIQFGC